MAQVSIDALKEKFSQGKKPTAQDFADLFESYFHRDAGLDEVVPRATVPEAIEGTDNNKVMTPLTTNQVISNKALLKSENLEDLTNTTTARDNLGLGAADNVEFSGIRSTDPGGFRIGNIEGEGAGPSFRIFLKDGTIENNDSEVIDISIASNSHFVIELTVGAYRQSYGKILKAICGGYNFEPGFYDTEIISASSGMSAAFQRQNANTVRIILTNTTGRVFTYVAKIEVTDRSNF